jgi:ribulose 1,5-bisphosphate synthetase/thiazole synthase
MHHDIIYPILMKGQTIHDTTTVQKSGMHHDIIYPILMKGQTIHDTTTVQKKMVQKRWKKMVQKKRWHKKVDMWNKKGECVVQKVEMW